MNLRVWCQFIEIDGTKREKLLWLSALSDPQFAFIHNTCATIQSYVHGELWQEDGTSPFGIARVFSLESSIGPVCVLHLQRFLCSFWTVAVKCSATCQQTAFDYLLTRRLFAAARLPDGWWIMAEHIERRRFLYINSCVLLRSTSGSVITLS